jgi:hypothetical protein
MIPASQRSQGSPAASRTLNQHPDLARGEHLLFQIRHHRLGSVEWRDDELVTIPVFLILQC